MRFVKAKNIHVCQGRTHGVSVADELGVAGVLCPLQAPGHARGVQPPLVRVWGEDARGCLCVCVGKRIGICEICSVCILRASGRTRRRPLATGARLPHDACARVRAEANEYGRDPEEGRCEGM